MDSFEIKLCDITAPQLRDEQKIDAGRAKRTIAEFDPSEFESFISEWLKFCRYKGKSDIRINRVGGTGDEGIDIIIALESGYDVVQCKRYASVLTLPQTHRIIVKMLWFLFLDDLPHPNTIFISSVKGVNSKTQKALLNRDCFKNDILENLESILEDEEIKYSELQFNAFRNYMESFDYSAVEVTDLDVIIQEYYASNMSGFRFSNRRIVIEREVPNEEKAENLDFIKTIETLLSDEEESFIKREVSDAKEEFFSALQLEATCEYLFGNDSEFQKVKNNIEKYVNNELRRKHDTNREKYLNAKDKAMQTDVSNSYLASELHIVDNTDKCGTCFILTNEKRLDWYDP